MLTALLLMVSAQGDLLVPVSYETRGRDLRLVLADLSTQTRLKLDSRGLENRPLIIRVQKMPLRNLLDAIAEVTDAKWSAENGRYIFARGKGREEDARRQEAIVRGERAKAWIKERLPIDGPLRPWGDADFAAAREENVKRYQAGLADMKSGQFRVASKADAITPAHIVLTDFLRQVKPEAIGGVQPDSRVIYASKPERGELALPMDLSAAVSYALQARERAAQVLSNPGDETLLRTNTHLLGTAVGKPVGVKVILSRSFSAGVNVEVMITAPNVIDYSGMAPLPAIPGGTLTVTRSIREARLVVKSNGDFWPVSKEELRGAPPANSLPMRMDHLSFRLEGGPGVIIRPHAQVRDLYLVSN